MPVINGQTRASARPFVPANAPLACAYETVRAQTEALCATLEVEDCVVSSMPDVSPTKWHLAHTSWFFETFVLAPHRRGYRPLNPRYSFLFNSYYVHAGERHCRAQRGLVTRPTVAEVYAYRAYVDDAMQALLDALGDDPEHPAVALTELGMHHEQQHQELLLTDIKHVFWTNPMRPTYVTGVARASRPVCDLQWLSFPEGMVRVGREADAAGFAFDNERPAHPGAVGEYNGKFMCDQWVLRGASCATPRSHTRPTYRNFFPSDTRWQFTGVRMAADA